MTRDSRKASEPVLVARMRALERTKGRYEGRRFDWESDDCLRMLRFHLRANGHRPPPVPRYTSALGAKKALKAAGHASVEALLDSLLERIAPAAMLPGDVAAMKGTEGLDAIVLCVGRKAWGWHERGETPAPLVPVGEYMGAWRVEPKSNARKTKGKPHK